MNNPLLIPDVRRGQVCEARATNRVAHLGSEDDGQSPAGDEEVRIHGWDPAWILAVSPAAGRDKDVDVRMIDHGAGPGVKDGEQARPGAEVIGIGREFQERSGGRGKDETVEDLLVRAGQGAKLGGQGEGDEEVGSWQETGSLPVEP